MKKLLLKILAVVGVLCTLFTCLVIPASAYDASGSFEDSDQYFNPKYVASAPYSLDIKYRATDNSTYGIVYSSTYTTRPTDSTGTLYSTVGVPRSDSDTFFNMVVQTSVDTTAGVIGTRSTPASNDIESVVQFKLSFNNCVLNPSLPQGTIALYGNDPLEAEKELFYQYYGYVAYPTTDGKLESLLFYYSEYLDYPIATSSTGTGSRNTRARFSFYPSVMHVNGNPIERLDVYANAYELADSDTQSKLVSPTLLEGKPVLFDYLELYVRDENPSIVANTSASAVNTIDYYVEDDTPREGESFSSIYQIMPQPDINDFNFGDFVRDGLTGILQTELFPGFKLYLPLALVLVISLVTWLLKVFAGG